MTSVNEWLGSAQQGLIDLVQRMAKPIVRWTTGEDYDEFEDLGYAGSLAETECLGSLVGTLPTLSFDDLLSGSRSAYDTRVHCIAVDIDMPVFVEPSTNEDHNHLYIPLEVEESAYFRWLDASADIGLLQRGYVEACKARGMTTLRAPWIRKGEEPSRAESGQEVWL